MVKRGRKPQGEFGGKSALFATRLTPQTRQALEWASARSGRSMSQEAEFHLRESLGRDRRRQQHIIELGEMVMRIAQAIEKRSGKRWINDAATGEALRRAIDFAVLHFAPRWAPPQGKNSLDPAELGTFEAGMLISRIEGVPEPPRVRWPRGAEYPEEWHSYWRILQAFGSGAKRNRPAWRPK